MRCIVITTIFIGIIISQYAQSYEMNGLFPVDDKFIEISGYVSELPIEKDGRYTYIITCDGAKYKDKTYNVKENVILYTDKELAYCQNIGVRGFLKRLNGKMNHNEFDFSKYYKSKNVFYSITDYEVATDYSIRQPIEPKTIVNYCKSGIGNFIDKYTSGDTAGILKAITIGYKKDFSDEFEAVQKRTGTMRFLYPGYLHILLIFTLLELCFFFASRKFKEMLAIMVILIYAIFNSSNAAILKSAYASIFTILFIKKYGYFHFPDILSALVIVILITNPLMIYNSGFVISVTISWLFFMLKTPVYKLFSFIKPKWLMQYIAACFLGIIGTTPLLAYFYDGIAPYTTLFTIVYLPVVAVTLVLFPLMWLETALLGQSYIFAKGILSCVVLCKKLPYIIDSIPFSSITLGQPSIVTIILFYLAVMLIREIYYKKTSLLKFQIKGVIFIGGIVSVIITHIFAIGNAYITFVNVGQGDGTIIELANGENIIVDGGGGEEYSDYDTGKKIFLPYLIDEGIQRIDMAIVTHFHKDHCLGTIAAMNELDVQAVAMPNAMKGNKYRKEIEEIAAQKDIKIYYLEKGDRVTFESGAVLDIISPSISDNAQENDTSIVFTLTTNGFKALFTGDITENTEKKYLADFSDVDILKVAHHGSDTSSSAAFIDKVSPEFAIISVGKDNTYNLPDSVVINRLKASNTHILRTDELGDIRFNIKRGGAFNYTTFYCEQKEY